MPSGNIKFPEVRADLVEALRDLSEPALHEAWLLQPSTSPLDIHLQELYDWYDFTELAEAARGIGAWLRDEDELRALHAVGLAVRRIADETGTGAPDQTFLRHPGWPAVVEAARQALTVMKSGLTTGESESQPSGPGFVVPYRHAAAVRPVRHAALEPAFAVALPRMEALLTRVEALAPRLLTFEGPPPEPRFDQDWFPRLDAAVLYALLHDRKPARVVEIGSGHSTRFAARAIRDAGAPTEVVCVDPAPRARLEGLPVRHVPALLQDADPALFAALGAGDVLFIDSSHVAMPGSDVDLLLNGVLPRLPAGALVHVHDVFLPDPYPEEWAWRGYNEQVAVGCLLQGGAYEILFASRYMVTRRAERVAASPLAALPLMPGVLESSLWLERTG